MSGFPPIYLCWWCKHFDAKLDFRVRRCQAFPEGIPDEVFWMEASHLVKYPNDQDIQFERQTDANQFPETVKIMLEEGNIHPETLFQITMIWVEEKRHPANKEIIAIEKHNRENAAASSKEVEDYE